MDDQSPYASPQSPAELVEAVLADQSSRRPWGAWATLGWGLLAAISWLAVQLMIGVIVGAVAFAQNPEQDFESVIARLENSGLVLAVITLLSGPAVVAVCALAAFVRGWPVLQYLGVTSFTKRDLSIGLACVAIFIPLSDGLTYLSGRPIVPEFMVEAYKTAGFLPLLILALVVGAPIFEEIFFRGFLYRGWAASSLRPVGAIVITSVVWAIIHLQYDWFQVSHIVVLGLLLGWLRWRSGSATLTVLLHGLTNLVATIETAIKVELLS